MRNHSVRLLAVTAAALSLAYGTADAQGKGKGNDKVKEKGRAHVNNDIRHDDIETRRSDGRVIVDRDGRIVSGNRRKVPPGLAKKPGQMPPGQYKKRYGTREGATVLGDIFGRNGYEVQRITAAGQSQYVYYRLPDGSIQRAIVSPGTDRLRFSNVPATLLEEVLRRLY